MERTHSSLQDRFRSPDSLHRPAPFWFWNGTISPEEVRRQIAHLARIGYGGAFVHARMGRETPYLGEEWLECVRVACKAAREHSLVIWLYDEDNWPSGYAGGAVLELGEWTRQRYAIRVSNAAEATRLADSGATLLHHRTDGGDELWFFEELHYGDRAFCPEVVANGYIDVFNPEVTRAFIRTTYDRYREALDEYWSDTIAGFFYDEPNYHELGWGEFDNRLPWSPVVAAEYEQRTGRSLSGDLPVLTEETPDTAAVRLAYYRVLAELFARNFTGELARWCENHGVALTGHVILEEHPRMATRCIGNPMLHYREAQIPGIDHLGKPIELKAWWSSSHVLCKQAQSAAHQLSKPQVMCETFAGGGSDFGAADQKWMADWMMALGVTLICPHAFHYTIRGFRKRDYPPTLNFQQPWADRSRPLGDHLGRLSTALTSGTRVCKIGVIHPIESFFATQSPENFMGEDELSTAHRELSRLLVRTGFDWDYVDETFLEDAEVAAGSLQMGAASYSLIVIPAMYTIRAKTLGLLEEAEANGCHVLVLEPEPALVDGIESDVTVTGRRLGRWDDPEIWGRFQPIARDAGVPQLLTGRAAESDHSAIVDLGPIVFHQRELYASMLFFIASESRSPHEETVRLPASGIAYSIDTVSGTATRIGPASEPLTLSFGLGRNHLIEVAPGAPTLAPLSETENPPPAARDTSNDRTIDGPENYAVSRTSDNLLILDRCDIQIGLETPRSVLTIEAGAIVRERAAAITAAGALAFRAVFRFKSQIDLGEARLLAETPEQFAITLNGETIEGESDSWNIDPEILSLAIPGGIIAGTNEVVLSGTVAPGTELEPLYIAGPFDVVFAGPARSKPQIAPQSRSLIAGSIVPQGLPFYAGDLTYRYTVELTEADARASTVIELNDDRQAWTVAVNGTECGTVLWAPYGVSATGLLRPGTNAIELTLHTTLRNALGPHHIENEQEIDCFSPADHFPTGTPTPSYRCQDEGLRSPPRLKVTYPEAT